MKCEHLGKIADIDPIQATIENLIVRYLNKIGAARTSKTYTGAVLRRFGMRRFRTAVNSLVEQGIVTRRTTTNSRTFLLALTDEGKAQAAELVIEKEKANLRGDKKAEEQCGGLCA
jgi:hypothetical protein